MFLKTPITTFSRFSKALSILALPAVLAFGAARTSQAAPVSQMLAQWYASVANEAVFPEKTPMVATGIDSPKTTRNYLGLAPEAGYAFTWSGLSTAPVVDTQQYLEYTITTSIGYTATVSGLLFGHSSTAAATLTARSSADNFAADLATTSSNSTSVSWNIPLSTTIANGQSLTVRIYANTASGSAKLSNATAGNNSLSAIFQGTSTLSPTTPPETGGSSLDPSVASVKKKATTKSGTFKFKGSQNGTVDIIMWKVGKKKKYKGKNVGRALTYAFKIRGLKEGKNRIFYYGVDLETGKKTAVKKLVVTRK